MSKEHDLMLNFLANPQATIEDFLKAGLNIQNTSLEDENVYLNSETITKDPFFADDNGNFDLNKFHNAYLLAARGLNIMATEPQDFKPIFSKYNIFAPVELRDYTPLFELVKVANPDRITMSMVTLGKEGKREYTPAEIALSQLVWNTKEKKWMDTPEDMFSFDKLFNNFTDFFSDNFGSTKVLAQYSEDVDINGKKRGEAGFNENLIEHYAGDYMLNDNGTYYYRTLDDNENIYGKQVLHYSDILTREGSALNAVDFLDSDDILKGTIGSFIKNASLIGSMFLPYVGPWIAGATIVQQAAGLGATLGKIALLDDDNSLMNWIEGISEATNPINTKSEWSTIDYGDTGRNTTWTIENLLGMVGEVVGQLKQQRLLFEYSPAVFKGKWGSSVKNQELLKEKYFEELQAATKGLIKLKSDLPLDVLRYNKKLAEYELRNKFKAADMVLEYMQGYLKYGEELSKAYMTLLTVNDIYGEAIEAGANDFDASLITAGYAAMEYKLLSTDIGKWILPELRANRLENKAVVNALSKDILKTFDTLKASVKDGKLAERAYVLKLVNFGKSILKGEFAVGLGKKSSIEGGEGLLKAGLGSVFAGALAEGTEESTEELLGDFSRALFNGFLQLKGNDDVRLKPFENLIDRYGMSFIGGFLGGGISSATFDFSNARRLANLDLNQAMLLLIHKAHNDDLEGIFKIINDEKIGNDLLSAKKIIKDEEGKNLWAQGDEDDNQDLAVKKALINNILLIKNTLDAHGGKSDDSMLEAQILKDIRFRVLKDTTTAGLFIQKYNETLTDLVKTTQELNKLDSPEVKELAGETDKKDSKNEDLERKRKDLTEHLNEIDKKIEEFNSGAKAPLFMLTALLESTPYLSKALMPSTFKIFAEVKNKKPFEKLTEKELKNTQSAYLEYLKTSKKDDLQLATQGYLIMSQYIALNLGELTETLEKEMQDPLISSMLLNVSVGLDLLDFEVSDEDWQESFGTWAKENQYIKNSLVNEINLLRNTYKENVEKNEELRKTFLEEYEKQKAELNKKIEEELKSIEDIKNLGDLASGEDEELRIKNIELYQKQLQELENKKTEVITTVDEGNTSLKKDLNKLIKEYAFNISLLNINALADKVLELGFINGAIKDLVVDKIDSEIQGLDKAITLARENFRAEYEKYGTLAEDASELFDGVDIEDIITQNKINEIKELFPEYSDALDELVKIYEDSVGSLINSKTELESKLEKIKKLNYTPVMSNLDKFSLGLGKGKLSELVDSLGKTLSSSRGNISLFNMSKDYYKQLDEAERIIDLYLAALEGARVDNVDPFRIGLNPFEVGRNKSKELLDLSNVWGINRVINEVKKKSPKLENDDWLDLPEIEGTTANMIIEDVKRLKKLLNAYRTIYSINQGLKLNVQTRVSTKTTYLMYDKLRRLLTNVNFPDKEILESKLEKLTFLKEMSEKEIKDWDLALSEEDSRKLESEKIQMDDAIYDFFKDKTDDIQTLKKIFNPENFNLWDLSATLLSEGSKTIDDTSFIGYLAAKIAIKSSSFYSNFKELLKNEKIAPLIGQEIGILLGLANILNGQVLTNIITAYKSSILELSKEEKRNFLKKAKYDDKIINAYLTEAGSKLFINDDILPLYLNLIFIDGIPGAGKSAAIDAMINKYIKTYHHEISKKAWCCHAGGNQIKFAKDIELESNEDNTFNKDQLMKRIFGDKYKKPRIENGKFIHDEDLYFFDESGQLTSNLEPLNDFNEGNVPAVIFIDEVQQFSLIELLALDKFAQKYGIALITSGDLDQSQLFASINAIKIIKEINKELEDSQKLNENEPLAVRLTRNQALHVPKLGTSMRSANNQKNMNLANTQAIFAIGEGELNLHYYEDENTIAGDKIVESIPSGSNIKEYLDKIIPLLDPDEKINFIVPKGSQIKTNIERIEKYNKHIQFHDEGVALGQEGNYWIVVLETNDIEQFKKDFYTGLTRSSKFTLMVSNNKTPDNRITITNIQDQETHKEEYNDSLIKKYTEKRVKVLEDILPTNIEPITIIPRNKISKEKVKNGNAPISEKNTTTEELKNQVKLKKEELKKKLESVTQLELNFSETPKVDIIESFEAPPEEENDIEEISELIENVVSEEEAQENLNQINGVLPTTEEISEKSFSEFSRDKISYLLFGNSSFEYGTTDVDLENRTFGDVSPIPNRIDGINGLMNPAIKDTTTQQIRQTKNLDLVDKKLGELRRLLLSIESKSELEDKIKTSLKLDNVPYIRFAIKTSSGDTNFDRTEYGKLEKDMSEYSPYSKALQEENSDSRYINNRALVAIIGTDLNGDIIEIPLLTLMNPITIIKSLEKEHPLRTFFEAAFKEASGTEAEKGIAALKKVHNLNDGTDRSGLNDLIELYLNTYRRIYFKDERDWTPAKDLINTGVELNIERGFLTMLNSDYKQTWNYHSLDKLKKDPTLAYVSNPMTHKDGKLVGYDGKVVRISNPKHPFVLFTDLEYSHPDSRNRVRKLDSDDAIIQEFIYLQTHDNVPKTVLLVYVLPPTFTLSDYILSLKRFMIDKQGIPLGNQRTAYKILEALVMTDSDATREHFIKVLGEDGANLYDNKILPLIKSLIDLPISEQVKILTTLSESWKYGAVGIPTEIPLYRQLQNVIKLLVYPHSVIYDSDKGSLFISNTKINEEKSKENLESLNSIFNKSTCILYYQTRQEKTARGQFVPIKVDDNGHIRDINLPGSGEFTVHGGLASSTFMTTPKFIDFIRQCVKEKTVEKVYMGEPFYVSKDDSAYVRNYSGWGSRRTTIISTEPSVHKDILEKCKNIKGIDIKFNPKKVNDNSQELIEDICNQINAKDSEYFAFPLNGTLVIALDPELKGIKFITNLDNNGQQIDFTLKVSGVEYDASISNKLLRLNKKNNNNVVVTNTNKYKNITTIEEKDADKFDKLINDILSINSIPDTIKTIIKKTYKKDNLKTIISILNSARIKQELIKNKSFDLNLYLDILLPEEILNNPETCSILNIKLN